MKKIKPEDIINSLENYSGEVKVSEDIRNDALKAVQKQFSVCLIFNH